LLNPREIGILPLKLKRLNQIFLRTSSNSFPWSRICLHAFYAANNQQRGETGHVTIYILANIKTKSHNIWVLGFDIKVLSQLIDIYIPFSM